VKLPEPLEFQWNKGNADKILLKHGINIEAIEEAFFDTKKKIFDDYKHSVAENRYILLGKNKANRVLYIIFTTRQNEIRVISARYMHRKEVIFYEKKTNTAKI